MITQSHKCKFMLCKPDQLAPVNSGRDMFIMLDESAMRGET